MREIMETIFDHNVTTEEMHWLLNRSYTLDEYLAIGGSENDMLVDIAHLYYHRGGFINRIKAKYYINKVTNPNLRYSFWHTVKHP